MLQDLCALRKNAWVPRREDNNPKTIDQIHREVQQEEIRKREQDQAAQAMRQQLRIQEKGMRPPMGKHFSNCLCSACMTNSFLSQ